MEKSYSIADRLKMLELRLEQLESSFLDSAQAQSESTNKADGVTSKVAQDNKSLDKNIIFNSTEIGLPRSEQPTNPESVPLVRNYNRHTHSRYSGGALIAGEVEAVEYDLTKAGATNPHSQNNWNDKEVIKKTVNTRGEVVESRGNIELWFNPDTRTWGSTAYYIDVKECYLIERDSNGDIAKDDIGNEKKSPLYNNDINKSSVAWDSTAKVWRLLAAYAPEV